MKHKIVICCNVYPPNFVGGAELIAHSQARILKQMGHEVIIFTGDTHIHGERHSLKKETYENLTVHRIRLVAQDYQPEFINFTHQKVEEHFKSILDDFSPDIVHFHNIIGLSTGIIHIAKSRGIKTILTLHDHWGFCYKNTIIKRENEICNDHTKCSECIPFIQDEDRKNIPIGMRKDFIEMQLYDIDFFISPSQYLAEKYIQVGFPGEKFKVIWNGIDVKRFAGISKSKMKKKIRFTFIGYLGVHKGINILLNALPLLERKDLVQINLVGSGEMVDIYKQRVKSMGLNNIVKFWGKIENIYINDAYSETDVLILPSIWPENQPVSITEAMAARIPVIASNIGGIPELVEDGKTGYLFEIGNAEQLAHKMSEFILHPDKLQTFGENSFKKIEHNTFENQVNIIVKLYNEDSVCQTDQTYEETLILCSGKLVSSICTRAMDLLVQDHKQRIYRFVMNDWIQEDQFKKAKILWVVDEKINDKEVIFGIENKIPLLVPENNVKLKKLCIEGNCGLYYKDALDAEVCLEFLINNEMERIAMGQNGFNISGHFKKIL